MLAEFDYSNLPKMTFPGKAKMEHVDFKNQNIALVVLA
jgi:hypothetical protein